MHVPPHVTPGRPDATAARPGPPRRSLKIAAALCAVLLFAVFAALGTWQVERRSWKHALIARVAERVHAPAVAAPGPDRWARINAADDEYHRVTVTGRLLHSQAARVRAVTRLGSGYWVLTPLRRTDGSMVWVNRGFVPETARSSPPPADDAAPVTVTGLLRLTEPGGGFLRRNDPAADRWFSRDVAALAAARGLAGAAPYFIDADAATPPTDGPPDGSNGKGDAPVGGLTVIDFPDNHLVYALTWYALALMVAGVPWVIRRQRRRSAHGRDNAGSAAGGRSDAIAD